MKQNCSTIVLSATAILLVVGTVYAGGKNDHTHEETHKHDSWESPPEGYANLHYDSWDSEEFAEKGARIYQEKCVMCHGKDGKGNGPVATSLQHPPADLTNHFHTAPGEGDGYLFWRISEGGVVEPFRSQKSSMPAFKSSLSEKQRWHVLTYVHKEFHEGFQNMNPEKAHDKHKSGHNH